MTAVEQDLVSMIHEAKWWNRVMQVLTASGTNYRNATNRLRMLTAAGLIHADMTPEQVIEQHGRYETSKMLHLVAGERAEQAREKAIRDVLAYQEQPKRSSPDGLVESGSCWGGILPLFIILIIVIYLGRSFLTSGCSAAIK